MAEVTYYVALPFVASDDGIAAGERRAAEPERFKDTLSCCLASVGYGFSPASASEFVEVLNHAVRSDMASES